MQELSGHWQVTEIADADLPAHAVITIDIENGEMRGQAACGRYRVALQVDGDRLNMGEIRRTEADCEYALAVAERDFIGVLEVSDRFEIDADGGLTLLAQVTPMIRARPREP